MEANMKKLFAISMVILIMMCACGSDKVVAPQTPDASVDTSTQIQDASVDASNLDASTCWQK